MTGPMLGPIRKARGVAGELCFTVEVTYEGEPPSVLSFVGNVYGGPVVMVMPSGRQTFVSDPGRFGEFGAEWVRRFFA
jgi:hypothetical protein